MDAHVSVNPAYVVEGYIILLVLAILVVWFGVCLVRTLVFPPRRARRMWFTWGGALAVGLLVIWVGVSTCRSAADRIACAATLRQIGLAMENYCRVYGSYPPAYTVDKQGNRLHSWRMLLLPLFERGPLRRQPRLDEPWNSPHNQAAFARLDLSIPYRCFSDIENAAETHYVMVIGPKCISNGPGCVRPADITDGKANTICLVEVVGTGIPWHEPRDLSFDEMSFEINDRERPSIGSRHYRIAHALFCDGTVRELREGTDPELIKRMLTINGGEDVSEFFNPPDRSH